MPGGGDSYTIGTGRLIRKFSVPKTFFDPSRSPLQHCYVSVKSKLQHPPPGAFDTFAVPGRREFDYQNLPGGGEFDPHPLGVEDLNCTLDLM